MYGLRSKTTGKILKLSTDIIMKDHDDDSEYPAIQYSLLDYGNIVWVTDCLDIAEAVRDTPRGYHFSSEEYPYHSFASKDLDVVRLELEVYWV
jgi:hypothetical protein